MKTQFEIQTPPPGTLAQEAPGGGGLLGSPFLFLAAMLLLMWALFYLLAPFLEEPWLEQEYGSEYLAYKKRVPRFLGFF